MDRKVIIFLVDGMRPDSLSLERTPVMLGLAEQGASSLTTRTVMPSVTLPCIYSLFAGSDPGWHGVDSNSWQPPQNPTPMLFELAHAYGARTYSGYNWEPLRDLARPGSLDGAFFTRIQPDDMCRADIEVAQAAIDWLSREETDFAFVYLGAVDEVGHKHGWMSPEYLEAVASADEAIGRVLRALPGEWNVIVTADHGGHANAHGLDIPEDMTVPLILVGPGIAARNFDGETRILDIAPTAARLLGLPRQDHWQGRALVD